MITIFFQHSINSMRKYLLNKEGGGAGHTGLDRNSTSKADTEKVEKFPLAAFLRVIYSAKRVRDSRHSSVY